MVPNMDVDELLDTFDDNMLQDLIDDLRGIVGEDTFSNLVTEIAMENSEVDHDELVRIISDIVDITYEEYLDLCEGNHTRHGYVDPDDLAGDRMMESLYEEIGPLYDRVRKTNDQVGRRIIVDALTEVFNMEELILEQYNPNLVSYALSCLRKDDPDEVLDFMMSSTTGRTHL